MDIWYSQIFFVFNKRTDRRRGTQRLKDKNYLRIAMLGHKRIPSREGGVEIVVEELATRMVKQGHSVICYNRSGHHVSGKEFDSTILKDTREFD